MPQTTKENYIFVYNLDNNDSLKIAEYYAEFRDLEYNNVSDIENVSAVDSGYTDGIGWEVNGQLVGIQCSSTEILSNETEFNRLLLSPLQDILRNSSVSYRDIYGIILGYNVPGGFYYDEEYEEHIISSTSRISAGCAYNDGFADFSPSIANKLYNRQIFSLFDSDDARHCLLCSRLDGPSYDFVINIIDQSKILDKQYYVDGTFYFDPYSSDTSVLSTQYETNLLDFYDNYVSNLELNTWSTTSMGEGIDVFIPVVTNDSFVWGWGSSTSSSSFFNISNAIRMFFYNADNESIVTLRDINSKTWGYLSLINNYCSIAGAMSEPGIDGYLIPTPFFDALRRGATLAESYLFSLPHLDWSMTLIGDPLSIVGFPVSQIEVITDAMTDIESWYEMSKELAMSIAYFYRKGKDLLAMENAVVDSQIKEFELGFLAPADIFQLHHSDANRISQYNNYVQELFNYILTRNEYTGTDRTNPSINNILSYNNLKISSLLVEVTGDNVSSDYILDEGWWEFEYTIQNDAFNFINYHFVLEVFSDVCLENLVFTRNSSAVDNWTYEYEQDTFTTIPITGVSSSFVGRRIRYDSPTADYLTRGNIYYFRVYQYDINTGRQYTQRTYKGIIYT